MKAEYAGGPIRTVSNEWREAMGVVSGALGHAGIFFQLARQDEPFSSPVWVCQFQSESGESFQAILHIHDNEWLRVQAITPVIAADMDKKALIHAIRSQGLLPYVCMAVSEAGELVLVSETRISFLNAIFVEEMFAALTRLYSEIVGLAT